MKRNVVLALPLLAVWSVACAKPAAIVFDPGKALLLEDSKGAPAPKLVVQDEDGAAMKDAPEPKVTFAPDGVVKLEGGKLTPLKNGKTTMIAMLEDGPSAKLTIEVKVIDALSLTCPEPCAVKVGSTLKPIAAATGLGLPLNGPFEWSSSATAIAEVDTATGVVTGKARGAAIITAKMLAKSATIQVNVEPNVDELRLFCPWPPFVVVRKLGQPPPAESAVSCETIEGESVRLKAETWAGGKPQEAELLWTASNAAVTVSKGEVTARAVGGAAVEAKVGDLAVELPVSVYDPKRKHRPGPAECAAPASFSAALSVPLPLKDAAGAQVPPRAFRCASAASGACVKGGVADIVKATSSLVPELKDALFEHALTERAARCCCAPGG